MDEKNNSLPEDFLDDRPLLFKSLIKVIVILSVAAVFLAVAAYFSFDWAMSSLVHSRKETAVPDITKKSVSVALDSLSNVHLAMRKAGEEYQPDYPSGSVIRQLPPAGTIVREGKVVRVWISQGSETIEVPDLSALTLHNAELIIRQAHLTVGTKDTIYSLAADKSSVISQDPAPKTLVVKGAPINLLISLGTPPSTMRLMPDFRHKKLSDVNLWASNTEIDIKIEEDSKSLFPGGTIIKQEPAPDSEVAPDSQIIITVSARPQNDNEKLSRIHYELPQGKNYNRVKIILTDETGEREILNEMKQPGSKIDFTVPYGGTAVYRIYVDGILVREKEIK